MISQQHRFHGRNSIKRVYQQGNTARGQLLNLKTSPRGDRPYRAAVVVSRKVSKSAVIRNRIRRRVYEQLRLLLPAEPTPQFDLVFMAFSEQLAMMPTTKLRNLMGDLLHRSGITPVKQSSQPHSRDIVNSKENS